MSKLQTLQVLEKVLGYQGIRAEVDVVGEVQSQEATKEVTDNSGLMNVMSGRSGKNRIRSGRVNVFLSGRNSAMAKELGVLMPTAGGSSKCTTPSLDLILRMSDKPPHMFPTKDNSRESSANRNCDPTN